MMKYKKIYELMLIASLCNGTIGVSVFAQQVNQKTVSPRVRMDERRRAAFDEQKKLSTQQLGEADAKKDSMPAHNLEKIQATATQQTRAQSSQLADEKKSLAVDKSSEKDKEKTGKDAAVNDDAGKNKEEKEEASDKLSQD